jgi:hypothetical protein
MKKQKNECKKAKSFFISISYIPYISILIRNKFSAGYKRMIKRVEAVKKYVSMSISNVKRLNDFLATGKQIFSFNSSYNGVRSRVWKWRLQFYSILSSLSYTESLSLKVQRSLVVKERTWRKSLLHVTFHCSYVRLVKTWILIDRELTN